MFDLIKPCVGWYEHGVMLDMLWLPATHPCIVEFGLYSYKISLLFILPSKDLKLLRFEWTVRHGDQCAEARFNVSRKLTFQHLRRLAFRVIC